MARFRAVRALLAAALLARGAALAAPEPLHPLSWSEAYARADATLAKMTETLLQVGGFCQRQEFVSGLLLQKRGLTAGGSPYYGAAGYFLYYDPHCDGKPSSRGRWVIHYRQPDLERATDLDGDGQCSGDIQHESENKATPPMGTHEWSMQCGHGTAMTKHNVTLRDAPQGEKFTLLKGVGWEHPLDSWYNLRRWWYVGNTAAVPRLGLPSLNMQDAAAGFRTNFEEVVGSVTVWPSLLAMGATWDPPLVKAFGEAMGREFASKGANGILGPSVNVHRVARNGRNFEYMSGEDPYLGSRLAPAYVEGVQSQGVFAVVKHWVFNQQETNRNSESSVVDDKTAWELYYPPFQAAVDAGVSAVMCSYNRVDGEYACSNKKQLSVLHDQMGFKGFVQSDWWATHEQSLAKGLDQEMPGNRINEDTGNFFEPGNLLKEDQDVIDSATRRVLAVMYKMHLDKTTKCAPPHCKEWFLKNVSTPEHVALARSAAARSVVLLKNEGRLLPLEAESVRRIAIIGAAADAPPFSTHGRGQGQGDWATGDYYSGGGSGHLEGEVVTPFHGLSRKAAQHGFEVTYSLSDDVREAVRVAKSADVAIVVAGTTSGESRDRKNLSLDGDADRLIDAVAKVRRTIVLAEAPGAVLMPWRSAVESILIMFLGGQETGNAWADVIFGEVAPEGRLPLMIPESEADAIAPGTGGEVVYSEGLETSYRNSTFKAAFPFGHGLTFTDFEYSSLTNVSCDAHASPGAMCLQVRVKNVGNVTARALPQLYLQLPPEAKAPSAILKGFEKTALLRPGHYEEVTFVLQTRDMSFYDVLSRGFKKAKGAFRAHVGASSADWRQTFRFCIGTCAGRHAQESAPSLRGRQ